VLLDRGKIVQSQSIIFADEFYVSPPPSPSARVLEGLVHHRVAPLASSPPAGTTGPDESDSEDDERGESGIGTQEVVSQHAIPYAEQQHALPEPMAPAMQPPVQTDLRAERSVRGSRNQHPVYTFGQRGPKAQFVGLEVTCPSSQSTRQRNGLLPSEEQQDADSACKSVRRKRGTRKRHWRRRHGSVPQAKPPTEDMARPRADTAAASLHHLSKVNRPATSMTAMAVPRADTAAASLHHLSKVNRPATSMTDSQPTDLSDPRSVAEARLRPDAAKWEDAISAELAQHMEFGRSAICPLAARHYQVILCLNESGMGDIRLDW
jgi:hypothetical protein